MTNNSTIKSKIQTWVKRYLPAEFFAYTLTAITIYTTIKLTNNYILAAYLGTIIDNSSYYLFIFTKDLITSNKTHKFSIYNTSYSPKDYFIKQN